MARKDKRKSRKPAVDGVVRGVTAILWIPSSADSVTDPVFESGVDIFLHVGDYHGDT